MFESGDQREAVFYVTVLGVLRRQSAERMRETPGFADATWLHRQVEDEERQACAYEALLAGWPEELTREPYEIDAPALAEHVSEPCESKHWPLLTHGVWASIHRRDPYKDGRVRWFVEAMAFPPDRLRTQFCRHGVFDSEEEARTAGGRWLRVCRAVVRAELEGGC
jgi:hypothetical protein